MFKFYLKELLHNLNRILLRCFDKFQESSIRELATIQTNSQKKLKCIGMLWVKLLTWHLMQLNKSLNWEEKSPNIQKPLRKTLKSCWRFVRNGKQILVRCWQGLNFHRPTLIMTSRYLWAEEDREVLWINLRQDRPTEDTHDQILNNTKN